MSVFVCVSRSVHGFVHISVCAHKMCMCVKVYLSMCFSHTPCPPDLVPSPSISPPQRCTEIWVICIEAACYIYSTRAPGKLVLTTIRATTPTTTTTTTQHPHHHLNLRKAPPTPRLRPPVPLPCGTAGGLGACREGGKLTHAPRSKQASHQARPSLLFSEAGRETDIHFLGSRAASSTWKAEQRGEERRGAAGLSV